MQQSPYCDAVAGSSAVGGVTRPMPKSKAEELAAVDARMQEAYRQAAASIAQNVGSAAINPKRKRRTKEEMAEVRAEAADRIRRVRRRVTPDWLADQDAVEEAFMETMRHEHD